MIVRRWKIHRKNASLVYEEAWEAGGLGLRSLYKDLLDDEAANDTVSEFVRSKIKETVHDPEVSEKLMPTYYFATKRPFIDTNYFETYNRENVTLVDVRKAPIEEITPKGLRTRKGSMNWTPSFLLLGTTG